MKNELWEFYNYLLIENALLKEENSLLRKKLGVFCAAPEITKSQPIIAIESAIPDSVPSINCQSSPAEKIGLFMSLFQGRTDLYAKRWYSQKSQKTGYQPVCGNEWDSLLCDKRKYKCNACPNRNLLQLDEAAIDKHLRGADIYGRDVVGVYPMLADETCLFLAVDFDKIDHQKDAVAFRLACLEKGIDAYIERSRSGNGSHVWLFFEEPVAASLARLLGSGLLTYTMNRSEIKFNSYDRLFPNQDTMPTGGFGNLIALPLQGAARKNGNSLFVNENFIPYHDQWAYLSSIQKLTLIQIEQIVSELCSDGDLGVLVKVADDEERKPWERSKPTINLVPTDFPDTLPITRANILYIPKAEITPVALNRIKRLGAFRNPDFYRAQAMRLPIYNKPRIISTIEETQQYIGVPRGAEAALIDLLSQAKVKYKIDDKTNAGVSIDVVFTGELRPDQQSALLAMMEHKIGVLSATTAFGKTVIGASIIAHRKVNTLVLVHTQALLSQWKQSLEQFLSFDFNDARPTAQKERGQKKHCTIGQLGAGKKTLCGVVDIAIMQSLVSGHDVAEVVRDYGMIIVDECHHVSAVNFERILKYAAAKYVYGLTATPTRQDGHHPIIFLQCGDIRYRVDAKKQANERPFDHFVIPRFTGYKYHLQNDTHPITSIYNDLSTNELRNRLIVSDILSAIENGRNPIVLTERTEHLKSLSKLLAEKCENVISLVGSMSAKEKREVIDRLQALPAGEKFVLLATGKYVGEGFDFPRLDTLFLAMPIAWKGKVAQYAGRLHRLYQGKEEVQIYDYVDVHVPVLERMYHKRIKGYAAIGYKTKATEQSVDKVNIIYDGKSFLPIFYSDIGTAKQEIVIVSPYIRKNRLQQMLLALSGSIINGVQVTVVTRPPEDFKEPDRRAVVEYIESLRASNIKVVLKSKIHQKFTVLDQNIVWYGSVNFLSFGNSEESIMRITSCDIARELLETL